MSISLNVYKLMLRAGFQLVRRPEYLVGCLPPMHYIDYRGNQLIICTGSHRDSNRLRKSGKIFPLLWRIYMGRDNSINS